MSLDPDPIYEDLIQVLYTCTQTKKLKDLNSDPDQDPSTNVTLICLYMYVIYQGKSEPKLKMVPQNGPISHFSNMGHLDIWLLIDNLIIHMIMDLLGLDLSF